MSKKLGYVPGKLLGDFDRRERLSGLCVLVADRDYRTASLVQRILFSFGFRDLDITTSGESALSLLRSRSYDIIITELSMAPVDGIALIKAIRTAKDDERIRRDIPIIMLTARTDVETVSLARDVGVTEFLAKPFSAKTISNRIIQVIDNPRAFVDSPFYIGPERRRKGLPINAILERRNGSAMASVLPANNRLQQRIGGNASEVLDIHTVKLAQVVLLKAKDEFLIWAEQDIQNLQRSFVALQAQPDSASVLTTMLYTAYAVQSQAGIFGFMLGGEVAGMLVDYLRSHKQFDASQLMVISMHIDAITVIFKQNIKEKDESVGLDMVRSLIQLTQKLG
jgi:DNA-binding response OmpR family regulator